MDRQPVFYLDTLVGRQPRRWLPRRRRRATAMAKGSEKTVLILCTGNYYRSRFAEALFNSVAGKMGLPWRAASPGLGLGRGVNNVGPMAASAGQGLGAAGVRAGGALTRAAAPGTTDDPERAAPGRAPDHP